MAGKVAKDLGQSCHIGAQTQQSMPGLAPIRLSNELASNSRSTAASRRAVMLP